MSRLIRSSGRLFGKAAARVLGRFGFILAPRSMVFLNLDLAALPSRAPIERGLRQVSAEEVRSWPHYFDGWYSRETALQRLEQGYELFVLEHDAARVCFGWVERSTVRNQWMRMQFSLPAHVAYLGGLYTVADFRGRGMARRMWLGLAQRCKDQGAQHVLVNIDPQNMASLKLHRKMGFQEYHTIHFQRFGLVNYYRIQSAHSSACRRWLTLSNCPAALWRTFWPGQCAPGTASISGARTHAA